MASMGYKGEFDSVAIYESAHMTTVDPTYPFYPIACILAAVMLLLVLLTSFIRQSWNLGVAFLCFWLFLENVAQAVDATIWADNADVKMYIYCDIVSHLQLICLVVKPMATLIITRRLHLIASLQSVELPNRAARHRNQAIEWTLGLVLPVLVAGPLYYIVQISRFEVDEGFGCTNSLGDTIVSVFLICSWSVIPPLLSIILYYPRVTRIFYHQHRDIDRFLRSNNSVSRINYLRILILASIDTFLTLPIGIVTVFLFATGSQPQPSGFLHFSWTKGHSDWAPQSVLYADIQSSGSLAVGRAYFTQWTSPVLAFTTFALFGVTVEARASYWRALRTISDWLYWRSASRVNDTHTPLETIEFRERRQRTMLEAEIRMETPTCINLSHNARVPAECNGEAASLVLTSSTNAVDDIAAERGQSRSVESVGVADEM